MIKKIVFLFLLFITTALVSFSSFRVSKVNAQENSGGYKKVVLVINQVRGNECCDLGSTKYLQQQINAFKENNLNGNFVVRYDALIDSNFSNLLKGLDTSQFELGAFLEITPRLAADAGVKYNGETEDWYKAQNAYTVGYSIEDRKKIIDAYMSQFKVVFGAYPKFSTAWIMDTDTVNYMNEKYGLLAHQITREQWGTDSYTLSGGPVHYPYFASENWLFAKSKNQESEEQSLGGGEIGGVSANNEKQTIILRQTGADPLFNYGDNTNSFTTQPNDYAIGKRGTEYFYKLKSQFAKQEHNDYGFLLLGLENSMDESYQDEFAKQLASIDVDEENLSLTVTEFTDFFSKNSQTVIGLEGKDFVDNSDNKSFWVNGGSYRVRFLYKNNELYISDLRLSNEQLEDPYNKYVAQDLAFWVTPFIFNASQQYVLDDSLLLADTSSFKDKFLYGLRKKYLPELKKTNFEVSPSHNDASSIFDGIKVADDIESMIGFSRNKKGGKLKLSFFKKRNGLEVVKSNPEEITFYDDYFETNFDFNSSNLTLNNSNLVRLNKRKDAFDVAIGNNKNFNFGESVGLSVDCKNRYCKFSFTQPTNNFFNKLREDYYPYFFPEIKDRAINDAKSVFYAHNQYAIADKNPVRLVFIPRDEKGFATSYKNEAKITVTPDVKKVILRTQQANGTTFIDIVSDKVGKYEVDFSLDGLTNKKAKVFFAPDCKSKLAYCVFHPVEFKWYLSSMFYTKLRDF